LDTPEEHETHLHIVFKCLRKNQLYLKWSKCELYTEQIDSISHIINKNGIHADTDKLSHIQGWWTPRNYNDIQRFVGLVNYLANFLMYYTGPLLVMTQNATPFHWRPIHQQCFDILL
jgi:hypothetical protein